MRALSLVCLAGACAALSFALVPSRAYSAAPRQIWIISEDDPGSEDIVLRAEDKPLEGLTVLVVIAPKYFQGRELLPVYEYLKTYGAKVVIGSTVTRPVYGMNGLKVKPNVRISPKFNIKKYDAVVFIGGSGVKRIWGLPYIIELARKFYKQHKLVAAICLAPVILAKADILTKKTATVWPSAETLRAFFVKKVKYDKKHALVSSLKDRVITANGPAAAPQFAAEIVRFLWLIKDEEDEKAEKEKKVAGQTQKDEAKAERGEPTKQVSTLTQ